VRPLPSVAEDAAVVVPKSKVGVTPGGVKYFDKDPKDSCSPFNPCSPQAGDIVKIKYKSFLSNGQMYDSSDGPGRKPLAAKYKSSPPQMIPGWVRHRAYTSDPAAGQSVRSLCVPTSAFLAACTAGGGS
jgi:hypothetical protein